MVKVLNLITTAIEPVWSNTGTKAFSFDYLIATGADNAFNCPVPGALKGAEYVVVIDSVQLTFQSTVGVQGVNTYITDGLKGHYLTQWLTALAYQTFNWQQLDCHLDSNQLQTAQFIFRTTTLANTGAGDAIQVTLQGHFELPLEVKEPHTPQPVSLEGYKWPLTRRV